MGNEVPREMSTYAQTEVTLAVLRDAAIHDMLANGKESSYTTRITRNGDGFSVQTPGMSDPMLKNFSISGSSTGESVMFNPMASGMRLPSVGQHVEGNYLLKNAKGQVMERDKFEFFGSEMDYQYDRGDKATIGITRRDANGRVIQQYNPALSEEKFVGGRYAYDSNGQPIRVARLSEGAANCGLENVSNPGNHRRECDFLVDDRSLRTFSYNQTMENRHNIRSVIRDGETVKAILYQNPQFDDSGNLVGVTTSIRKPDQKKK